MEANYPTQSFPLSIESDINQRRLALFFVVAIHLILIPIYLKFNRPIFVVGFLGVLAVILWSLFSIKNTLILLFCYISFLPNSSWGSRYDFFQGIYFKPAVMIAFTALILLWILAGTSVNRNIKEKPFSFLDASVLVFLILTIFSALRGGFTNGNIQIITTEIIFIFCYAFYFLYTRKLRFSEIEWCWQILLIITLAVSFQFVMLARSFGGLSDLMVNRIVTQQPHLAQLAFPFCAGYLFFANSKLKKGLALLAMFLMIPMIFLSQQRALWGGIVFSLVLLSAFAFFKDGFTVKTAVKFMFLTMTGLALLVLALFIIDRLFTGSVIFTLLSRIGSLTSLSTDISTNVRLSEINRALAHWQSSIPNILFGTGLGSAHEITDPGRTFGYGVDSSFAFILWKLGVVGLASFTILLFSFLKRGIYVLRHTVTEKHKQLTASLLAGFSGLLIIGLTNASLVLYRFIIIWALVLATIEVLYQKSIDGT